jgi:EAL domain-containing protein (putative c-di-GMP-specific phosphodiesterase class I)
LTGFEALIRWDNPELGFVSPGDFIPLAEESGLIVSIGEWVLMTACRTLRKLQDKWQIPLRMAVNISPRQFQHDSLMQTVSEALHRSRIEPCYLELELTEGMVMNDVEQAIAKMEKFNSMGVQLAIDDFGTGYSSLGYLKKFPISRLKIDKSFVNDLVNNRSDQAIVNSVIALGKNMSLEIVAEGIETTEQYDYLEKGGCDQGQGFLMGEPLSEADLASFLDSVILAHPEILSYLAQKSKAS